MGIERGDVAALGGGRRETRSRGVGIDQRGFERWVLAPRGEKALGEMGIGRRVRLGLEGRGRLGLGLRREQAWPGCWAAGLLLSLYL